MRLNAKTHPSYIKMMEGRISEIPLEPKYRITVSQANPMIPEMMMEAIGLMIEEREKVWYCTDSFFNAAMTAIKKIDGVSWDAIHSHSGVFITNWAHIVYNVQQDSEIPLSIYIFNKEYLIGNLMFNREFEYRGYFAYPKDDGTFRVNDSDDVMNMFMILYGLLWFIENCDVETYMCKSNQKQRIEKQRFFNESKQDLIIYSCNWFTELIRDTPFSVRGHWRLQPYGEKRGKRRLKWIEPFEKSGYHRKAQVIN